MPPASKRKRNSAGGGSGPKSKKGKKKSQANKKVASAFSSDSDAEVAEKGENDEGEGEWVVEEVVDKRFVNGRTEYFLKWKNWPPSTNTWEPIEHLENCPELVERYEEKLRQKKLLEAPNGFDEGFTVRAVRGVVQLQGAGDKKDDLYYLVEWEDHDTIEKIPAVVVRDRIPHEVIKFLSSKIKWSSTRTPADEDLNGDSNASKPELSSPTSSSNNGNNNDDSSPHELSDNGNEDD